MSRKGFSVGMVCAVLGVSKSGYYAWRRRTARPVRDGGAEAEALLPVMRRIIGEHPFWGYRRIWAWLCFREGWKVNKKKVYRLLKEHHLLVPQRELRAKRTPQTRKPQPTEPNQWWGIDMTKWLVPAAGWVYLVAVTDWYTRQLLGYHLGLRARAAEWIAALEQAVASLPDSPRKPLSLMSDNGSQPTSTAFFAAGQKLGVTQAFTSYNNPKGNANTERFFRTFKEEVVWPNDFKTYEEAKAKVEEWLKNYNTQYLHSALGYKSPAEFEKEWLSRVNNAA